MKPFLITALIIVLVCVLVFVLVSCKKSPDGVDTPSAAATDPVDFKTLSLSESGMSALVDVYEAEKTENGVRLSHVYENMSTDERVVIRTVEGGEELLKEVQKLLGDNGVLSWNGFAGANPPGMLDGTMFSFECVLADGNKINAHGSNNFPANYGKVMNYFETKLRDAQIDSTEFKTDVYGVTLPESWVGNVTVAFGYEYHLFTLNLDDIDNFFLVRIDLTEYEPMESEDSVFVGKLVGEDKEYYLSFYLYNKNMSENDGTAEQYAIFNSLDDDLKAMADSVVACEGYELIK